MFVSCFRGGGMGLALEADSVVNVLGLDGDAAGAKLAAGDVVAISGDEVQLVLDVVGI
jgi:hypothetical protein